MPTAIHPHLTPVRWACRALIQRVAGRLARDVYHRKATALSRQHKKQFHPHLRCSKGGEDGILQEMFRRLDVVRGWFVELGAWDGVRFSNTYALGQQGWNGVGIECDQEKFRQLQQNMAHLPGYFAICQRVSRDGENRLDAILRKTPIPRAFDLLSLDIDSHDYWIWDSLREYRPTVVVIEYNPFFSAEETKALPFDKSPEWPYFGASAAALERLGRSKDYMLVGYTGGENLFFVREDLAHGRFERLPVTCVPAEPTRVKRRWTGWTEFVDV